MPDQPAPERAAPAADALIALSTFPTPEKAAEVGRALVEERLAACVNVVSGLRSIYRWQGAVAEDAEALAIIKTTRDRLDALTARLIALHPYELPELVALPVGGGHAPYLAWIAGATR